MIRLNVNYENKDIVKAMGAKWNATNKYWYIPNSIEEVSCFKNFIENYDDAIKKHLNDINIEKALLNGEEIPFPDLNIVNNYTYNIPELKNADFVVLDTETTGTYTSDEITELGIIDSNGKEVYRSLFSVNKKIPRTVSELTGITNEKLIGKPKLIDEWETIKTLIKNRIIVAYNTPFDYRLLKQTIELYGGNPEEVDDLFCNYLDAMQIYCKYENKGARYKLARAASDYGIDIVQTHRATDDCLMTLKVLQLLDTKISSHKIESTNNTFKEDVKECLHNKIFDISDIANILNCDSIKVEDCIIKDFTINEIKDIPGFKFEYYYTPYEFLRITAYISKKGWDGKYKSIKSAFPEISYQSIKFIIKAFKKEA